MQRLLGYFVHEPNLGSLEGQDPIRLRVARPGEKTRAPSSAPQVFGTCQLFYSSTLRRLRPVPRAEPYGKILMS